MDNDDTREFIEINGVKIVAPVRAPLKKGQDFFTPALGAFPPCEYHSWVGTEGDYMRLKNGVVHLNAARAVAHAEALISITKK